MKFHCLMRLSAAFFILLCAAASLRGQGSMFSFNGRLAESGAPSTGLFDIRVGLFAAETGGTPIAGPLTFDDVSVTNGLFTITLDFGSAVFDGNPRWLGLEVRPGASVGTYTTLSPRLQVMSSPYAIRAA